MKQYRGSIKTDKVGSDCAFVFEVEAIRALPLPTGKRQAVLGDGDE